jgi:hypothetical protein
MDNSSTDNDNGNEEESWGGSDVVSVDTTLTARGTKKRKSTALMSREELLSYFEKKLDAIQRCPNQSCECVSILHDRPILSAIASYLAWFEQRSKYEQDSILLQWAIYYKVLPKSNMTWYHVPYDGSCFSIDDDEETIMLLRSHLFCSAGLRLVVGIGKHR